jgi:(E)-4-hydroxy-3-methylbut-2-enyl-diphosphate synthase
MSSPRSTRSIRIGSLTIGGDAPIMVQSMAATRTQDVPATRRQLELLTAAGADLVRIAVDSPADVKALAEVVDGATVPLSIDLQENYRLASDVAPFVQKLRYNPGHLHHHEKSRSIRDKVAWIADTAKAHDCALRVGCNAGSLAPDYKERFGKDHVAALVAQAVDHCAILDELGFHDFCVSIKDSDPRLVVEANERFAAERPDVPLHLGVTEAGMPPDGVIKTRIAFEQLIPRGIGDTLRVSLTVPFENKGMEIEVGRQILADIEAGRFRSVPKGFFDGLNIIACPSCSRVENERFIDLAQEVKEATARAAEHDVTIAVMGCRVNGPGETDDADLGLWCGPKTVNLKRGPETVGTYSYDDVLEALLRELDAILAAR